MKTCLNCGELNGDNRDTCYKCGREFGPEEGHVLVCRCGAHNRPGAQICHNCGKSLKASNTYKKCPNCGKTFPLSAEECSKCHYKLFVTGDSAAAVEAKNNGTSAEIPIWKWVVAFLFPLIGIIMGVCMISVSSAESTESGKRLIIGSIVFMFVAPIVSWIISLIVTLW